MDDRFEATFVIARPIEEVWEGIAARDPRKPEQSAPAGPQRQQYWLAGFESTGELLEIVPFRTLRVRKDQMPCQGTEIAFTLESVETGTSVTVVQSGFGAFFNLGVHWLEIGWDLIVKDLVLYLERGVFGGRHMTAWGPSLGCAVNQTASGLVATMVDAAGAAGQAGLAAGDHVMALADVPVASIRDLSMVMRTLGKGDSVSLRWLRGSELLSGTGTV